MSKEKLPNLPLFKKKEIPFYTYYHYIIINDIMIKMIKIIMV